jgi:hypothetical protein
MTDKDKGARPKTSSITRTVTGSKDDIIGELQQRVESEMATYRAVDNYPRYVREHARGIAEGVEYSQALIRDWELPAGPERLYGLTADEWFRLASMNAESEIAPCCGNIGELRDLLRELMTFQSPDETGWRIALGERILLVYEADGNKEGDSEAGHGLGVRAGFPLLNRVLDGIRAEQRASKLQVSASFPAPGITADSRDSQ